MKVLNVGAFQLHYFIAIGVFTFNVPQFFIKGHKYDPVVEKKLHNIKKMVDSDLISKEEAQLQYTAVIREYIKQKGIHEAPPPLNEDTPNLT